VTSQKQQVIRIHAEAPPKPALGAPCNGCGVCCASEPCPVGVLVSRRRSGACKALLWNPREQRYRCGVMAEPERFTHLRWRWLNRLATRLAARMIAAGRGCDSAVEVEPASEGSGRS
jgi:hypothetical protein